jgi:putative ABC transport system permease protein
MNLKLWFRYALRNLRSGLRGFWIFLTCLTLGTAAIAIIGSLGAAVDRGLTEQGQPLMGGDVEFSLIQRQATEAELAYMAELGTVSDVTTLRAMATANEQSTLVEIKAVDTDYPLYGTLTFEQEVARSAVLDVVQSVHGIAADPLLMGRLNLKIGDLIKVGTVQLQVRATIANEPDRISEGIVFGPRLIMKHEALKETGLVQPGSLVTWRYRVKLRGDTSLTTAKQIVEQSTEKFPDAGWRVRARDNAAGGAERFVERLQYFMTLVSIAALVIGGAGIANAVAAFVNRRVTAIATLKCLGVATRDVFGIFLSEIVLVGLAGIAAGLLLGAVSPWLLHTLAGDILPLPVATRVEFVPLVFAGILGLLVTLAFAVWPLSRIAKISGTALFRTHNFENANTRAWHYAAASVILLGLAALTTLLAFENMSITAMYLGGLIGSFVILGVLAWILLKIVGLLPRPKNILLRHALTALDRPGASSLPVIMALGLGLTLFVTLALTDQTISRELRAGIPEKAPAFFVLDVRNEELAKFRTWVENEPGVTGTSNAPMMRGRIVALKDIPADQVQVSPDAAWALRGDRGLTYAEALPEGSKLVEGTWWPANYAGPPLVSMVDEIANGLGLKIGDAVKVNVLGREIEAKLANLRQVNWRSMGINFVMVFDPNTLTKAPHSHIVTIDMVPDANEAVFLNKLAATYPSVTAVRVKDALATASDLFGKMLAAVRGANVLTLLIGVLVLAGALAAGLSTRSYEAVVLKTYGATRRQLLTAFTIEYGLLGLVSALFGIAVGAVGAWYLSSFILELPWVFSLPLAAATALMAMVITIGAGLVTTARALSVKPSGYLRNE